LLFIFLELNIKELNGAKFDKSNSVCQGQDKHFKKLIVGDNQFESLSILDVKNFKIQNIAFLIPDLKYKLSMEGWTFVASYEHNYVFVNHTSKEKSVYGNLQFFYFSDYIIAEIVKNSNLCIYQIEIK
jgi:hypothetical protein